MGPFKDGWCKEDVEAVLRKGDPSELPYVPIVVSLDPPECQWAQNVCVRLARHPDPAVRGNAILGFGHLARTCRRLDELIVRPLVESALRDTERYVLGHAIDAVDDLTHYLGWKFEQLPEKLTSFLARD
jgi:hypothetical protein